jgi:hypothetical protein
MYMLLGLPVAFHLTTADMMALLRCSVSHGHM